MTNPFYHFIPGQANMPDAIKTLSEVGFKVMDLNMCAMQRHGMEFCEDDKWIEYTEATGEAAAKYGVKLVQSHPVYPKAACRRKTVYDEGAEYNEFFYSMMKRCLEIDSRLGIEWAVMHPVSGLNGSIDYHFEEDLKFNIEYYTPLLDLCEKNGVGFAFENMANVDGHNRFAGQPEDLIALTDAFKGRKVGICWDTGHGNRNYADQLPCVRLIGDRLVCTHIDDNIGQTDLHQMPLMGTVDWNGFMQVLKDIDYKGAFIYELAIYKRLPDELVLPLCKYSYQLAEYLLKL